MALTGETRRVLALFNPKSGIWFTHYEVLAALRETWDTDEIALYYQESKSPTDGKRKVKQAIADGVDTVLVIGGDGMVNTIGSELVGSKVALAVVPAGSGNGFARHFGIPLRPAEAARVLFRGSRYSIDVGFVGRRPFFVTSSLAWDAELVKGFDSSPVRGVLPYVFSGIYHYFTYEPQDFEVDLDGKKIFIKRPLLLTVANLTQFGGGATIAPNASPDDGLLSLVAVPRMEPLELLSKLRHLFDGRINEIPEIHTWDFKRMMVKRQRPDPIQIDGELIEAGHDLIYETRQGALKVILPDEPPEQRKFWSVEDIFTGIN